jgi:hypothetical protein
MNFDNLTLGEIEEIELLTGSSLDDLFKDGHPKGRAMRAIYYISRKKNEPDYKFEDSKDVTQKEAVNYVQGNNPKDKN